MRMPTQKAKTAYSRLVRETKEFNRSRTERDGGPDNWTWANMPIAGESNNLLKDLEVLAISDYKHIQRCIKLGINPSTTLAEWKIVASHIQDRIAVAKEVYGSRF